MYAAAALLCCQNWRLHQAPNRAQDNSSTSRLYDKASIHAPSFPFPCPRVFDLPQAGCYRSRRFTSASFFLQRRYWPTIVYFFAGRGANPARREMRHGEHVGGGKKAVPGTAAFPYTRLAIGTRTLTHLITSQTLHTILSVDAIDKTYTV